MIFFESFVPIIEKYLTSMASLGEILNQKIGTNGKSKAYVASELGVSERTIENYMKGVRNPKPDAMVKLSKILKFDLSQLSERIAPPEATLPPQNGKNSPQTSKDTDKVQTATTKPDFGMKPTNGHQSDKDLVIKEQAQAANKLADSVKTSSETIKKLVDLLSMKGKD